MHLDCYTPCRTAGCYTTGSGIPTLHREMHVREIIGTLLRTPPRPSQAAHVTPSALLRRAELSSSTLSSQCELRLDNIDSHHRLTTAPRDLQLALDLTCS